MKKKRLNMTNITEECPICGKEFEIDRFAYTASCPHCGWHGDAGDLK